MPQDFQTTQYQIPQPFVLKLHWQNLKLPYQTIFFLPSLAGVRAFVLVAQYIEHQGQAHLDMLGNHNGFSVQIVPESALTEKH